MTRRLWRAVVGVSALALVVATPAFAQTQEERAAARALVQSRGDAVVMVLATVKLRINIAGREQTVDRQVQANATVLDASGLAVMSLMNLQPDEAMSQSLNRGAQGARVDVTSDIADLTMHLADGRELPAKLVLRDEDLDLAFVRPTDKPSAPLVFVDAPAGTPAILDPVVLIQRTSESTDWKTAASMGTVQLLIDKPRPVLPARDSDDGRQRIGRADFRSEGAIRGRDAHAQHGLTRIGRAGGAAGGGHSRRREAGAARQVESYSNIISRALTSSAPVTSGRRWSSRTHAFHRRIASSLPCGRRVSASA